MVPIHVIAMMSIIEIPMCFHITGLAFCHLLSSLGSMSGPGWPFHPDAQAWHGARHRAWHGAGSLCILGEWIPGLQSADEEIEAQEGQGTCPRSPTGGERFLCSVLSHMPEGRGRDRHPPGSPSDQPRKPLNTAHPCPVSGHQVLAICVVLTEAPK